VYVPGGGEAHSSPSCHGRGGGEEAPITLVFPYSTKTTNRSRTIGLQDGDACREGQGPVLHSNWGKWGLRGSFLNGGDPEFLLLSTVGDFVYRKNTDCERSGMNCGTKKRVSDTLIN
jgi:hypothetical protein